MSEKKRYSLDFKHQVLQTYYNEKTFTETVKQYGISGTTLSQWIKKEKEKISSAEKQLTDEKEVSKLKEENKVLFDIIKNLLYDLDKTRPTQKTSP